MFSKSFLEGFAGGLASPATVLDRKTTDPRRFQVSTDEAWEIVGTSVGSALNEERKAVGKTPIKIYVKAKRHGHRSPR